MEFKKFMNLNLIFLFQLNKKEIKKFKNKKI